MDLHTRIQRAVGAIECEKVMSRHVYWHAAGIHREEYEQYWSKRVNITWGHGFGQQNDRYSYYNSYILQKEQNVYKNFKEVRYKYPEVENVPVISALAEYPNHFTATPIIEVAEDGKSAKGLWYTPGFINNFCQANGQIRAQTLFERYGGDFVLENGRWVYTNLRVFPDIGGEVGGGGYAYRVREVPKAGAVPKLNFILSMSMARPYVPGPLHSEWNALTVPQPIPLPTPYKTASENWSYADVNVTTVKDGIDDPAEEAAAAAPSFPGMPGGAPGGFPGGAPGGFPGGAPGGAPGGFPGGAPGGFPGGAPGGF